MVWYSQLPKPTLVNKVIPKNAFDPYCSAQKKRLFIDKIERIRWTHKLAWETTNLPAHYVKEIQCFEVELRQEEGIEEVIRIIDRAIPYPILFKLILGDFRKWQISKKHPNPTNEDNAVIDWTFESPWSTHQTDLPIELKISLDEVFRKLCLTVAGEKEEISASIDQLVIRKKEIQELETKINKIKASISKEKQFNKRVELNLELQTLEKSLATLNPYHK
ncbi:MAG: DUF4391 domain-containing protein [Algoriphagus sp.]|nr:DUF4391 domain-containing protein [Algoriphagus sp.]